MNRSVHGQYQIDILALDPEDCQKDVDFVLCCRVELVDKLDAFEDRRGRSVASPIVPCFGDTFYRAGSS